MTSLHEALESIAHPRILVIGDLILDKYTFGNTERVSPEAPVLVLRTESKEVRLGGAASVAMLLRGLEAEVTLAGVIGDDSDGQTLLKLLDDEQIDRSMVLIDGERPTTVKERFVGQCSGRSSAGGQQVLRVDHETQAPIGAPFEEWLALETATRLKYPWGRFPNLPAVPAAPCRSCPSPSSILDHPSSSSAPSYDAILISDYAKGVCTERLVEMVLVKANERRVAVVIDPARIADYERYRDATLLKPNRFEAEFATGRKISTPDDALAAAKELSDKFDIESVLVTLDSDGMALLQAASCRSCPSPSSTLDPPSSVSLHLPIAAHEVYDITGAGDMVLATLGLCLASAVSLPQAAQLANIAAGLEVERLGVAPITRAELHHALVEAASCSSRPSPSSILHPRSSSASKLTTLASLIRIRAAYRDSGKSVVFTNGCFDLLHVGHVTMLEQAAALGDVLIVAINSDASVRDIKGQDRPVIPERDRAQMLASLGRVDHVLIFDDPTPHKLLEAIQPDVLVKGGTTAEIVGREVVEAYGGRVCQVGEAPGVSTTRIVFKIHSATNDQPGTSTPAFSRQAQPTATSPAGEMPSFCSIGTTNPNSEMHDSSASGVIPIPN